MHRRTPVKPFAFGVLSLALAVGINFGEASIQDVVTAWIPSLHWYVLAFHLLIPAVAIAGLAYAMGLWSGSTAAKAYVLILCVVVPPIASVLAIIFAVLVLHAPML